MKMKGIDIFCASQASTTICMSMENQASSSSSSVIQLGGRALDRHNPIIQDARRSTSSRTLPIAPCSSQSPINPKAYHQLSKSKKKNSSSSPRPSTDHQNKKKSSTKEKDQKRKSSNLLQGKLDENVKKFSSVLSESVVVRKSSANPTDLITPPGSTRYLLSDTVIFDGLSDYDPVSALVPVGQKKSQNAVKIFEENESTTSPISSSSSLTKDSQPPPLPAPPSNQVVVLMVSLHCKGCVGKLRKHLSRMEGVTSFNIDFAAKKVTVTGDVTPLSVLASVSKVKNAQFWPTVSSASPASPPCPTKLEAKKEFNR
ncbi:flocculation protein FLO11-like [Pyrus ussuriensis x Pyrus communis]|uniref:Flocculation protein FLO11-like n=1 Tax=Pyrus ussuriensis x Pyrus communis TaxID=2448454 RepID=A0A5N5H2U3_9ROSA|nr:flocculation protein FLO11-like [Pyrus ussuriensis x Pyrus communis]